MAEDVLSQIDSKVKNNKVMLFMKGTPDFPQCGFSAHTVEILKSYGVPFETADVLICGPADSLFLECRFQHRLQFTTFMQLVHYIATADEFTAYVNLWDRRPIRIAFNAFAH